MANETTHTYNLLLHEDTLSSQYGQNPSTARSLINFIPSRAGDLKRKSQAAPVTSADAPGVNFWSGARDYIFYDGSGNPERQYILIASNNVGYFFYKLNSGGTVTALPGGAYTPPHNPTSGWIGDPVVLYSDGLLYISDGSTGSSWTVYDGTDTYKMGLDIPTAPTFDSASTPGSIDISIYREYVITEFDSVHKRESPPSARLRYTPATPATYDVTLNLPARVNNAPGSSSDWTVGYADKFRIYASHVDGSDRLYRIAEVTASDSPGTFVDTIPFFDVVTSMTPLDPPYRNHKPLPSRVGAKMHNRFVMRDETKRSKFWITGFSEVLEQDPSSVRPLETVPGARNPDITELKNLSDYINSYELADESFEIRSMMWWEEGLLLGTEKSVQFLWGSKPEDFRPTNTSTYSFGLFNKNAFLNTTHGLVMFTSDRKLVLDPAATPVGGDRTSRVIDIGWAKQPVLDQIRLDTTPINNLFQMVHFQHESERDWLVVAYTTQAGTAHLIVYDFGIGGWLTFDDVKATCIGILQEDGGYQFLVAGNSIADKQLRVVANYDPSSTSSYGRAASRVGLPSAGSTTFPANTYRTSLMDLGSPEFWKVWRKISFFQKGGFTTAVTVYLDPADIDSLSGGVSITFNQLTSNEFQGWIGWKRAKRAVFEFTIASDGNEGSIQGIEINVDRISKLGV